MKNVNQSFLNARPKVLIIDDVLTNLKVLLAALSEDYDVILASSGRQGLDLAEKTLPDIIMLDISMPGMDGLEVCRRLKTKPETSDIPVVFSTAMSDSANEAKGLLLGAADFITKPLKIEVVKLRLRNIIDSRRLRQLVELQNRELSLSARLDSLTKLPNRLMLDDRLKMAMTQAARSNNPMAVLFIDLDGFKGINDQHGHIVGDHLLVALANRIQDCLRKGDTLARIGGDEFVALITNLDNENASLILLQRILDVAASSVIFDNVSLQVSASVGVTFFPQTGISDGSTLIDQADQAMYQAKKAGKSRYAFFNKTPRNTLQLDWNVYDIELALEKGEFELVYAPELDLASGQVVALEALLRWHHPAHGLLGPDTFLSGLEKHALSITIGEWVLRQAIAQQATWLSQGLQVLSNVNIGKHHLSQTNFAERLQQLLDEHENCPASRLKIDICEMHNTDTDTDTFSSTNLSISQCRDWGVAFALNDFGTGQSSLTYLRHMPINQIKLDPVMCDNLVNDQSKQLILGKLIALLKAMEFSVLAEGVQTQQVLQVLQRLGCDQAQGGFIGAALPAHEIPGFLSAYRAPPFV